MSLRLSLTLTFLLIVSGCSLLQSGKPIKSVAFPEFQAIMPHTKLRYEVVKRGVFNQELHPIGRHFAGGSFQVSFETANEGDSLKFVVNISKVVMNGWLKKAYVRVIPTKQLPLRARDDDIAQIIAIRRGRLVELTRDFAKARFTGSVSFRPPELLWHPHEFNPTSQEASDFIVSVLLFHKGGAYTRRVYYQLAVRPKQN